MIICLHIDHMGGPAIVDYSGREHLRDSQSPCSLHTWFRPHDHTSWETRCRKCPVLFYFIYLFICNIIFDNKTDYCCPLLGFALFGKSVLLLLQLFNIWDWLLSWHLGKFTVFTESFLPSVTPLSVYIPKRLRSKNKQTYNVKKFLIFL